MHAKADAQNRSRGAIFALLCSATIHLLVILVVGPSPLYWQTENKSLNAFIVPAASEVILSQQSSLSEQPLELNSLANPSVHDPEVKSRSNNLIRSESSGPEATDAKPYYFLNSEVDTPAEPLSRPNIVFPELAFVSKLSGKVRARIYVNLEGQVVSIEILESRPQYPAFEEVAINALREIRYAPAKRFGQAVHSQRVVEVLFNPYEDSPTEATSMPQQGPKMNDKKQE